MLTPVVTPVRRTRKVKGVEPLFASALSALRGVISRLASSLRIVPPALLAAGSSVAPSGEVRLTWKSSSSSRVRSPLIGTLIVRLVWPGLKVTEPLGKLPPKSIALTTLEPLPGLTVHCTVLAPVITPLRWITKLKGVVPLCPSLRMASSAVIARLVSSLRIVPLAESVGSIVAPSGVPSVTVNSSSSSASLSPRTPTLIVRLVWPGAKVTVPLGSTPPLKSVAAAEAEPEPATAQLAVLVPVVTPVRLTVNRKEVVEPLAPSA